MPEFQSQRDCSQQSISTPERKEQQIYFLLYFTFIYINTREINRSGVYLQLFKNEKHAQS